jgi:hypothetical protein
MFDSFGVQFTTMQGCRAQARSLFGHAVGWNLHTAGRALTSQICLSHLSRSVRGVSTLAFLVCWLGEPAKFIGDHERSF